MGNYQATARKYRPQKFSEVIGQKAVVQVLEGALRMDRVAHAYLFCGPRGIGKTTLARLFAKALNCKNRDAHGEPCGECSSCVEIASGHSLDVLEIDGASNRGIDDIRQLNETVGYAPASGKWKIYLIDEVHMLTKEAFNALLKTLEEPPAHVKFFFATTEPHKVLPTIISRCQRLNLHRPSVQVIADKLKKITDDLQVSIDEKALLFLAKQASGSVRDAESLLDQVICYCGATIDEKDVTDALGLASREHFFILDKAIHAQELSFASELTEELFSEGKDFVHFLESLLDHFRIHLHFKIAQGSSMFALSKEEIQRYKELSSLYTKEQLLYSLDYLTEWLQKAPKTNFPRLLLEMILLHLLRSRYLLPLDAIAEKLSQVGNVAMPAEPVEEQIKEEVAPLPVQEKEEEPASPPPEEKKENLEEQLLSAIQPDKEKQSRYETLVRFAAVELDATISR